MQPHSQQVRQSAVKLHLEEGISIREISRRLKVSARCISQWIKHYQSKGEKGLLPNYKNSGRISNFSRAVIAKALEYKSHHPQWGAPFILVKLEDDFPNESLPSPRWLQKIFRQQDLQPKRTRLPNSKVIWANKAFDRVQVDAKEGLKTKDGQDCCYLNFTDEYTGSELEAFFFPLRSNLRSSSCPSLRLCFSSHAALGTY